MTPQTNDDTIAAIATPIGEGGISVLRVSGREAIETAAKGFRGKFPLAEVESHTAHFGNFVGTDGGHIDQVVATVFKAPHSYTSDDTVEISCHGGMFVTRRILEALYQYGARPAEPGEFTRRAFLNGRIDLAQAEAVADLIRAKTEQSRRTSIEQLEGKLSSRINELRESLLKTCGLLELELDFSEEGLEFVDKTNINKEISGIILHLNSLVDSYRIGKIYREGAKVVIAGKPNVGKSSLMNALLNENRAIVTEIPGTTRDTIEENLVIDGVLFKIVDTAGLRESRDVVENEGIKRSSSQIESADIVIILMDRTQGITKEDKDILDNITSKFEGKGSTIIIENKIDLKQDNISKGNSVEIPIDIKVSAKTGEGLNCLEKKLVQVALQGELSLSDRSVLVTNERHKKKILDAVESLKTTIQSLESGTSNELVAIDLRAGLNYLGEIIGTVTSEDILNTIFSKFCIGK